MVESDSWLAAAVAQQIEPKTFARLLGEGNGNDSNSGLMLNAADERLVQMNG